MLTAIIMDFDGVILESVDIKTRAFRELFKEYPDHLDQIMRLHLDNLGISRFEKFKTVYRDILHKPLGAKELARLGEQFSHLVYHGVLQCPMVPGARDFLEAFSKHTPLFLCSATPEEELLRLVRARGLEHFFRAIYGSPKTKEENLQQILSENHYVPADVIYIGDAINDYRAARRVLIPFIGRVPEGLPSPFPPDGVVSQVRNLEDLSTHWDTLTRK